MEIAQQYKLLFRDRDYITQLKYALEISLTLYGNADTRVSTYKMMIINHLVMLNDKQETYKYLRGIGLSFKSTNPADNIKLI